ncbi:MAG: RDD family protein [Caldilineaceae bacterium]|nr:RDD family protein [Caldilineaceae bacterium]
MQANYCSICGLALEEFRAHAQAGAPLGVLDFDNPAGFVVRLLAFIIDLAIVISTSAYVVAVFRGSSYLEDAELLGTIATYIVSPLYFTALIAIWRTTVGKGLFRLYVVRADGSPAGLGRSFARHLAVQLLGVVGSFVILFREDNRGLHDLICDTVVTRRR